MACILKVKTALWGSDAWSAGAWLLRGAESAAVPPASSSQLSLLALMLFLFLWQMQMEGDAAACSLHSTFPTMPACLLAPAREELRTAGCRAERGCVRRDGDGAGRRGGVRGSRLGSAEPRPFRARGQPRGDWVG